MKIKNRTYQLFGSFYNWLLILGLLTGVFHKFIANDLPVIGRNNEKIVFPVVQEYMYDLNLQSVNPRNKKYDIILPALIPFSPYTHSLDEARVPPLHNGHLLGTDTLGRDLTASLIHGTWNAITIGIFSIMIAFMLALLIGGFSGYMNGRVVSWNTVEIVLIIFIGFWGVFYGISEFSAGNILIGGVCILCSLIMGSIVRKWYNHKLRKWQWNPVVISDMIIQVRESIPGIFLVLASLTFFTSSSLWNVALVIGLIAWSNMARYIRSEVMSIRRESYIMAAESLGYSDWRIFFRHILPNAMNPILATVTFTIAAAILMEASLSFLGIGIPIVEPTWGALLSEARLTGDWWMALFPGMAIFLVLISLHYVADRFQQKKE